MSILVLSMLMASAGSLAAQPSPAEAEPPTQGQQPSEPDSVSEPDIVERVEVDVVPGDPKIAERLERILNATRWFQNIEVRVAEGVVTLEGATAEERYREWAGNLARRTEGVTAVVNRLELLQRSFTDFGPAAESLAALWEGFLRNLPLLVLGALLVLMSYAIGRAVTWALRSRVGRGQLGDLVRDIRARAVGLVVFVLGVYLALRVAGLTRLAATILGGTGIVGLVLGIAFRDLAENLLASILLTRQQPFRKGDLVEIEGIEGFVQRLTIRATILMTLDGNHVQIPNATVYKSAIRNFTSNPTRRIDFSVGIGYPDSIARAQEIALSVITKHPAVLQQPEPWVLAENLGSAAVTLRVYVWLDGSKHSWLKVRSSVIRLVKRAFQEQGISMPDEAREVVFPEGVPVRLLDAGVPEKLEPKDRHLQAGGQTSRETDTIATGAEGGLDTDASTIGQMADQSRTPEAGQDLLEHSPETQGR